MLAPVPEPARPGLRPLFAGLPGLHGCLDAALDGAMGAVHTDDLAHPRVALIELDFHLLAGDAGAPGAEEAVRELKRPASVVVAGESWEPLLRRVWGDALRTRTRVAFEAGDWDRERLAAFAAALPEGYRIVRVGAHDVERFAELADSLVYNFLTLDAFVERGVGYGIERAGRFVSGCSSFAISDHSLEFEIQTHADVRRRGLASAVAARMIEHCLDSSLEPCWDAHNEMSAALATKLGFVRPAPYPAYQLPAPSRP